MNRDIRQKYIQYLQSYQKKKKIIHLLPQFFFFKKKTAKTIKTCFNGKETQLNLACMVKSNLCSRREVQKYQNRKTPAQRAFSIIPK